MQSGIVAAVRAPRAARRRDGRPSGRYECVPTAFAAGLLMALSGCQPWSAGAAAGDPPPLTVLHISSERALGSGFAIGVAHVLTAGHAFVESVPAAAVDGLPMMLSERGRRVPRERRLDAGPELADDWAVLAASQPRFAPPLIDPDMPIDAGDRVVVGGFRTSRPGTTVTSFLNMKPEFVEGTVVDPRTIDTSIPLVMIEVPAGDYGGFSGGPAAKRDAEGRLVVWGLMTVTVDVKMWVSNGNASEAHKGMLMGILRIPKAALDAAPSSAPASRPGAAAGASP